MSTLANTQQNLQDYLLYGNMDGLQDLVVEHPHLNIDTRLKIYFDGYRLRLIEALTDDFEKLKIIMGEERFDKLAREYIDAQPSRFFSLRDFGGNFPEFLHNHADYQHIPFLAEMAKFEWAMAFTLDAADAIPLSMEYFSALPAEKWPELKIQFHPSVRMLQFSWDVPEIWYLIEQEEEERAPQASAMPVSWLIFRKDNRSYFRSCSEEEAWAYVYMQEQHNFAQLCEALSNRMPEDKIAAYALSILRLWLDEGLIVQGHPTIGH